jgi:RNA polymerase sigma-70 factor (ECF subfamily)
MTEKPTRDIKSGFNAAQETTASLLRRVRDGDSKASERLLARYLPVLQRWAHGRLPKGARDIVDTDDLVQDTLTKALRRIEVFDPRKEGAFLAYLRQILINEIRKQAQRVSNKPRREGLSEDLEKGDPSPLEEILTLETLQAYESAFAMLPSEMQEAIMLRIELRFSHRQVAEALGYPSADAARMQVARAVVRLAEAMHGRR